MKIHFIAIGGSVMHNLALALQHKGETVSGSDDEIFDPAKSRLAQQGILPAEEGWYPEKITTDIDAVILGMHAKEDNPELIKARQLNLKIFSFPEFLYQHASNKRRVVIGGSHGKTTITAMIMHVLRETGREFDYMVGAQLKGFDVMVRLSEKADLMVFEGDEYLTSALDKRPKFHLYKPHIAVISGIEWDHMNVFPTKENYIEQFRIFVRKIEENGTLIYCSEDKAVREVATEASRDLQKIAYGVPEHINAEKGPEILYQNKKYPVQVFGKHNLMNLNAARLVCRQLGISDNIFYEKLSSFEGAAKRLELLAAGNSNAVYKDFAHAPSKLRATIEAVKSRFPEHKLTAVMELHTYSSLNKAFLPEYKESMQKADTAIVFYNPHAFEIKKLPFLNKEDVREGFQRKDLLIFNSAEELQNYLLEQGWENRNLLMMSSGDFGGVDLDRLAKSITAE